jgi:uncharacterized cupredoxin-like copper-binding protein
LTDITCDDTDSSGDTATGVASFVVDPGETVRCVFTNTKDGRIEIEKQTLPDGDTADFTFTGDVAATLSDGEFAGEDVAPGNYASTETVPAGWELTDITCDDTDSSGDTATGVASFVVDPGETVRCVFTNTKDVDEGCTPGFWRQDQHLQYWESYAPTDVFDTIFGVNNTIKSDLTLLEGVWLGGGGENALIRHAVAALLNAASSEVDYPYSEAQVIAMVQAAYASGDFTTTKNLFATANEAGCSL